MSTVKLNLGELKQTLKINTSNDISGMQVLEVVPDAGGMKMFGIVVANKDGSNRRTAQLGFKLVEEGAIAKNEENGELTISDGYEIRQINGNDVVVNGKAPSRKANFTFTK